MSGITAGERFKSGLFAGLGKGWSGFLWMMKIIIPISFLTALLAWSGLIEKMDFVLRPLMGFLGLPPVATLPLIVGALTGIYGGVASMAVLPLSMEEMTLVAIFLLIAHNLVQEGIIQGKSGVNPLVATVFRLVVAVITVFVASLWLSSSGSVPHELGLSSPVPQTFSAMVRDWGLVTMGLVAKIFCIIMMILTALELLKSFGWAAVIVAFLAPVLTVMGLSRRVGILWMTAVLFGLSYGGAVIVEEVKNGNLSKEELETLHLSIGINHSMIEDPSLFLPLGLSPFWLWVPRLIVALLAVRLLTLWHRFRPKTR